MNIFAKSALIALLAGMATVATAASDKRASDELFVTSAKAGRGGAVSIDFDNRAGAAVGFEFKIKVPTDAKVNTSNCLADLPKSHTGVCMFNHIEGYVLGMVFSDSNELLPKGMVPVGRVLIRAGKQPVDVKVEHFLAADANAKKIESSAKVLE